MENRVRGNEYRTTIVCIDSYENSAPMGRFYNPYDPQGESFCGLTRLLVRMTDLLDAMDFPQSFTVARSFVRAPMNPPLLLRTVAMTAVIPKSMMMPCTRSLTTVAMYPPRMT